MSRIVMFFAILLASIAASASAAPLASERPGQSVRPDGSYQLALHVNDRVCCIRQGYVGWATWGQCKRAGGQTTANKVCRKRNTVFDFNLNFNRVCCKRGWQDWWSSWGQCQRAGGYVTSNRECREDWNDRWDQRWWGWGGGDWDRRVCCKQGRRDWWTTARECRNSFGYETSNRECRNDNWGENDRRICCKRGWQDWWTTWRACQRAGGQQVRNKECREDWNDKWDQRWWGWGGGDWNRRVCCKRGNNDWWTTARECRNSFGYETSNRECRNDGNYNNNGNYNDGNDGNTGNNGNYNNGNDGNYNDGWVDPYGRPDRRVCCKKGNRDWWSTARECHYANGNETRNDECRND